MPFGRARKPLSHASLHRPYSAMASKLSASPSTAHTAITRMSSSRCSTFHSQRGSSIDASSVIRASSTASPPSGKAEPLARQAAETEALISCVTPGGAVTILLGFTQNATMFYVLRFLLGLAEAGFFPGVLFALTLWFPQAYRGRMVGWFMIASAIANAVGAFVGGLLLELNGVLGLAGWQWVFLATGIPAILLTFVVLAVLPDGPDKAPYLGDEEKGWLRDHLAEERRTMGVTDHANPFSVLLDRRVL